MAKKKTSKKKVSGVLKKEAENFIKATDKAEADTKTAELRERFGSELYDRATLPKNKIGMTNDQLDDYTDPNALKMACDNIKPQVTPQETTMRPRPPIPMRKKGVPTTVELESVMTVARAQHVQRSSYDESEMRGQLMRMRIPYETVQSVVFNRDNKPSMRKMLTTKITVNYLK